MRATPRTKSRALAAVAVALVMTLSGIGIARAIVSQASQTPRSPAVGAGGSAGDPGTSTTVRGRAPGAASTPAQPDSRSSAPQRRNLPPANGGFDYQLGGAYALPDGVTVVGRDRTAAPAPRAYSICYVNGFQTQPGESASWLANHPELLLRDAGGEPVIDPEWPDEYVLDISTAANRSAISAVVGPWISGCRASGFDAVEIDNLDTYERFPTRLTESDAVALITDYARIAHRSGLAIGQKNAASLVSRRASIDLDFAIVEQCGQFNECQVFTAAYGDLVFVIEYQEASFTAVCAAFPQLSVVRRDVTLRRAGQPGYVRTSC